MNKRKSFSEQVKQARKDCGMTQVTAAKRLGVARQTYIDLENGTTVPRLDTVLELSSLFNKDITYFICHRPELKNIDTLELLAELQLRDLSPFSTVVAALTKTSTHK